jgi:hypothetical protein
MNDRNKITALYENVNEEGLYETIAAAIFKKAPTLTKTGLTQLGAVFIQHFPNMNMGAEQLTNKIVFGQISKNELVRILKHGRIHGINAPLPTPLPRLAAAFEQWATR